MGVDSKKWVYGPGTIHGGCPSFLGLMIEGQLYSKLLASTAIPLNDWLG